MKIADLRLTGLAGGTVEGGWAEELEPQDNINTVVEVVSDDGRVGVGSAMTSLALVDAGVKLLRPLLVGERAGGRRARRRREGGAGGEGGGAGAAAGGGGGGGGGGRGGRGAGGAHRLRAGARGAARHHHNAHKKPPLHEKHISSTLYKY